MKKRIALLLILLVGYAAFSFNSAATGTKIDIPVNTWVWRSFNKYGAVGSGGKHQRLMYNPDDGKIYFVGGDHSATIGMSSVGAVASGRNEMYTYSIATDQWEQIQSYCLPGIPHPGHPDQVAMAYDQRDKIFWLIPGYMHELYPCACSGQDEVFGSPLTYDPVTRKWTVVNNRPGLMSMINGNHSQAAYDPMTHTLITIKKQIGGTNVLSAYIYHIDTDTYERIGFPAFGSPSMASFHAIDVIGRRIYVVSSSTRYLYCYNIDAKTMSRVDLPADCWQPAEENNVLWDSANRVVHYLPRDPNVSAAPLVQHWIYSPSDGSWTRDPVVTKPSGLALRGRAMVYDPGQDVIMILGSNYDMLLYRYSPGTPIPKPVAPSNLRTAP